MSKNPPNFRGKLLSDIHFFGQLSNAKATTNDLLNLIFCQNSLSLPLENTQKKKQFSYKFWNGLQEVFKNFNFLKQGFFTADPNFHLFLNYKTQYYQPVQSFSNRTSLFVSWACTAAWASLDNSNIRKGAIHLLSSQNLLKN